MSGQTHRQRKGDITTWVIVVLAAVLVGLLLWLYLGQDQDIADEQRIAELAKASLAPAAPAAMTHDWPQWRGPNRDGLSSETGLLTNWPTDLLTLKAWEAKTGAGYSTVAVAQGRVYGFFQDGEQEAVVCWEADSGKERWRYRYAAFYKNDFGNGPRSTPTVDGDRIYTVGATGLMHCLKTQPAQPEGEVLWKKDLLKEFEAENLRWGVSFSPLVVGDLIYVNPGGPNGKSLAALNKYTGEVKWTSEDDRAGYSSPVLANLAGKKQIVFFTAEGVLGVDPDNGKLYWRYPWSTSYDVHAATPIVTSDYVFISSGYGRGCAVLKIEPDGQGGLRPHLVYKNRKMKNHFSSCVLYKDYLYGFNDSVLTCMEFRTGKVCWEQSGFNKGSVLVVDGHLIILGETGLLALAEATPDGYRQKATFQISERRCWSVPVFCNGRLYVRDEEKLICLKMSMR